MDCKNVIWKGFIKQCIQPHSLPPAPTHPKYLPTTPLHTQNNVLLTPTYPYLPKIMLHTTPLTPPTQNNISPKLVFDHKLK